jgi:hypothetical protein
MNSRYYKILELPYQERRLIIIKPDLQAETIKSTVSWSDFSDIASVAGNILINPIGYPIYSLAKYLFKKPEPEKKYFKDAIIITATIARQQLNFPPGHPLVDHAYVGHPIIPERYIPYANFHRFLFEEKVNELISILASLGAIRVLMACRRGYKNSFAFGASASQPLGTESGNIGAYANSSSKDDVVFEEYYQPSGKAFIPNNLVWYGHEASWQAVAKRRLENGTTKFKIMLSYEEDFGINASLTANLQQFGINLGGNYSKCESTKWEFEGEFL